MRWNPGSVVVVLAFGAGGLLGAVFGGCESPEVRGEARSGGAQRGEPPAAALGDTIPGIHNVFAVAPGVFSGSGPESEEAFAALEGLGVRTIISVDGSVPEVEMAHAHGMRYVHIPVGYDGITPEQALGLARAVRDVPGPIYVHCHHGKHRGPTGAAVALVGLGRMTNAQAVQFMKDAGTAESYPGLWECARGARAFTEAELAAAPADFPEARHVSGLVDGMVAIDKTWERVGAVRKAGWRAPADHPDLAPAAEAGMLADHFRTLMDDAEARVEGAEFLAALSGAMERTTALEATLAGAAVDGDEAERAYAAVSGSCNECHKRWRN